ncbi:unnamed protein product [Leuciscus chuanchicus]
MDGNGQPSKPANDRVQQQKTMSLQWKLTLQAYLQVHFEDDQFTATKKGGKVKLRPDAVPTIFIHRPKPKRRKPPSVRVPPAPIQTTTDHTYYKKCKFEIEEENEMVFEGNERDMTGDRESNQEAPLPGAGDPGMFVPRASQSGASSEETALPGPVAPETRLPGTDRATQMQIPLPNIRTLQRRMQHVKLEPGVLGEVFDMLRLKAGGMSEMERECVLSLDEMSITPGVELHMGTGKLFGNITLPDHEGQATHALVFMLAGVTTRWKQVVAYHYSGNSTKGAVYRPIIVSIVEAAASVGRHVLNITTDMGSPNRAMWKSFGVTCDKPWIQHPVEPNQRLHFMPDVPHLIKNLKSAIIRGHIITIPQDVVEKEQLASNEVSVAPLKDLVSFQEGMALKLAPNLSRGVLEPSPFEKMKVSSAMHVFSKSTSAALRYMVEEECRPESYLTTSWFLEKMDHWFDLMSSCNVVTALGHFKMEEYEKAISFLRDSIHLFQSLKISTQGSWKPRNSVPTPVEFHYALRAVTVGQFLSTTHTGSYLDDASDNLADFLDTQNSSCSASEVVRVEQLLDPSPPDLTKTESCVLYHLAGYIVKRVIGFSLCGECQCALVEKVTNTTNERALLLELKEFKRGALYRPSDEVFTLLRNVEQLFRLQTSDSLMESSNVVAQLEREAMSLDSNLPSCHELKKKILSTYIRLRLRIQSKCIRAERKVNNRNKGYLGSKSQTKKAISTQQISSAKVITSRPLQNTFLVAMDVFGFSIPGTPSTASSLLSFQQPSPAAIASTSRHHMQQSTNQ